MATPAARGKPATTIPLETTPTLAAGTVTTAASCTTATRAVVGIAVGAGTGAPLLHVDLLRADLVGVGRSSRRVGSGVRKLDKRTVLEKKKTNVSERGRSVDGMGNGG